MDNQNFELTKRNTLIDSLEIDQLGGDINDNDDKIRLYIGTNPMLLNIRDFILTSGKEIPKESKLFKAFNIYILSHSVGIIKEGGWEKINQVGYRMEFTSETKVVVLHLLPQSLYTKKLGGEMKFEASLDINGELKPPSAVSQFLDKEEWIGASGKIKASTSSSIIGNLSLSVYSNEIQTIGKNGNYSEWLFSKSDLPIHGKDIEMIQILLVDRFTKNLNFRCKAFINKSSWLGYNSMRRETDWISIEKKIQ